LTNADLQVLFFNLDPEGQFWGVQRVWDQKFCTLIRRKECIIYSGSKVNTQKIFHIPVKERPLGVGGTVNVSWVLFKGFYPST
jgi:hypothetical protein